jgi:hypothetical protein
MTRRMVARARLSSSSPTSAATWLTGNRAQAERLDHRFIGRAAVAFPAVVATLMWGYLYREDFGPIAPIARAVGLGTPELSITARRRPSSWSTAPTC